MINFFFSSSSLSSFTRFILATYKLAYAALRDIIYGGSYPKAVPKPHKNASSCTAIRIPKNEIVYKEFSNLKKNYLNIDQNDQNSSEKVTYQE